MYRAFLIALFLLCGVTIPVAHAQIVSTDPITIDVQPQYPQPYETVSIVPSSTVIDLSASVLTFSVNGKVVARESGSGPVSVTVGGPGTVTNVLVTATNNGQSYSAQLAIRPAEVSLVVEPVSTTHAFYRGGSLVASQGRVRLIAIPDLRTSANKQIPAQNLVYTWHFGDQVLQDQSGIGHSILTAVAPVRYRDATVTVTVTSQDDSVVAEAQTTLSPVDPVLRIYQDDPLLGPIFDKALSGTVTMNDAEDTFREVGYYFSVPPTYAWQVNSVASGADKDITVRSTGNGQGTALLSANTVNPSDATQEADGSLSLSFGQKQSLGVFGL